LAVAVALFVQLALVLVALVAMVIYLMAVQVLVELV
jgi:hypothetical protein